VKVPELIFVVGCNAAGKSTFIRSRLSELTGFEIIMTDVYKGRTKEVFTLAVKQRKDIIIETVFNDLLFKDLIDLAASAGYHTSLIVLFLDNLTQSKERVAFRLAQQSGLPVSDGNIKINFEESFKNVTGYYLYFDRSDFIYTGIGGVNRLIMSFHKDKLVSHVSNDLVYPKRFAEYSYRNHRLSDEAYRAISGNQNL